jgi:hypothetical protein
MGEVAKHSSSAGGKMATFESFGSLLTEKLAEARAGEECATATAVNP